MAQRLPRQLRPAGADPARHAQRHPHRAAARSRGTPVADAICFDVAYDDGIHAQLARRRGSCSSCRPPTRCSSTPARSTSSSRSPGCGRWRPAATSLVAATNGVSGVIAPDGTVARPGRPAHPGRAASSRSGCPTALTPGGPARAVARAGPASAVTLRRRSLLGRAPVSSAANDRREGRSTHDVSDEALRPGRDGRPDLQRGRQPRLDRRAGCAPREPDVDVLVVDDNSPDGTGRIADELAADDPQVHVLHRDARRAAWARRTSHGFARGARRRLRRDRRDGRRRLPPARAAAPAARRARRTPTW